MTLTMCLKQLISQNNEFKRTANTLQRKCDERQKHIRDLTQYREAYEEEKLRAENAELELQSLQQQLMAQASLQHSNPGFGWGRIAKPVRGKMQFQSDCDSAEHGMRLHRRRR